MNLKTFLKKPLYYSEKCNKTFIKHIDKVKYKSGFEIVSNKPSYLFIQQERTTNVVRNAAHWV